LTKLGLSFNDIVEEIPVTIHNSRLSNAMLYELEEVKGVGGLDFERLDLSANPFLERNLDSLIECMIVALLYFYILETHVLILILFRHGRSGC
jgi:translation initiation factor 3 subunit H